MKLEKILDRLNTIEKTSFSKIIDGIISKRPKNIKEIDKILSTYSDVNLRSLDSHLFSKVFELVEDEYYHFLNETIDRSVSQLDILIDILIKDGNCIMSREWLNMLYQREVKKIKSKVRTLRSTMDGKEQSEVDPRMRDFMIYRNCVTVAYRNDLKVNSDLKITADEKSIINELARNFDLSQEEVKLLNYIVLPLKPLDLETIIELLRSTGIILYSKKNLKVYIPEEFVRILRKYRGKEVADKYLRRVLKLLKEPELNLIARKHGIDRKLTKKDKIKHVISEGVGLRNILKMDIYRDGTTLSRKKERINNLVDKGLDITHLKGTKIDLKIDNLIDYFNEIERDEKVGISLEGYGKLLEDLSSSKININNLIKSEFELQSETFTDPNLLLDYNIKPRDILEILSDEQIKFFCGQNSISTRGNEVLNVLGAYKDSQNIELENYADIAFRNLIKLKENGIRIKEADLGSKFEELTRLILQQLGLQVDEELRTKINTVKDKIDIIIRISDTEVFLVECKSVKEKGFNKFSSVSRQIKAYKELLERNGLMVTKALLIAPEFSDDFVNDVELDYSLNLSLLRASSLMEILAAFKSNKKFKQFPHMLLMKDVLIQEERILRAIGK